MVGGAFQVVDENRPPDADLIAQQSGMLQFRLEGIDRADDLARMRFPGVDEEPRDVRMAVGGLAK